MNTPNLLSTNNLWKNKNKTEYKQLNSNKMKTQIKYYMVLGKNRHIPKTYYTKATSVANAKEHFYIDAGDKISSVIMITKTTYEKNKLIV